MSETWKDKLTARLAELDAQIAALSAERTEIMGLLGANAKRRWAYGSRIDAARALLSDGKTHRLSEIAHMAGVRPAGFGKTITEIGAVRVSRGLYRMPDGGWPVKGGAK